MFNKKKKILFLGAHPDDIVLGAGATISKHAKKHEMICYTFSHNTKTKGQENLPEEEKKALKHLGILEKNINILDFETREFPRDRQKICDTLWSIRKKHNPDIIFTHSANDLHQDHIVLSDETKRAFRDKTILGMEVARSQEGFKPKLFIKVKKADLNKKIKSLSFYKTFQSRYFMKPKIVEATAISNGVQIEAPYVEAFEIVRHVSG